MFTILLVLVSVYLFLGLALLSGAMLDTARELHNENWEEIPISLVWIIYITVMIRELLVWPKVFIK
jgi:hypothetical protein